MPRCFSMSIQSETAWRALCLPLTEPAWLMAPPYSSSFSVRVVLPASGWLMMANVRRRSISSRFVIVPLSFYRERNDAYDGFRSALHGSGLLTVPSDLSMTHIFYITPKRPRRARGKSAVLGLFFQHKAGQGRAGGPVGKAAGQYRVPLQGQRVQPGEDRLLFGVPDHRAAVQHRGEDAAGTQRPGGLPPARGCWCRRCCGRCGRRRAATRN